MSAEMQAFTYQQLERCWPWIAAAIAHYGPTHTKQQVWDALVHGHAQLWPMPRAVMVTQINNHFTGFKEAQAWMAGGDLKDILEWTPRIEQWARDEGCARAVVAGRRGWLKVLDNYHELITIMAKDLQK